MRVFLLYSSPSVSGGSCAALLGGNQDKNVDSSQSLSLRNRNPFSANVFGSICYTVQQGKFKEDFNDLTRLDARVDFSSVPGFVSGVSHLLYNAIKGTVERKIDDLASPKLTLIFQQQVNIYKLIRVFFRAFG